jgi:hypothetical protein
VLLLLLSFVVNGCCVRVVLLPFFCFICCDDIILGKFSTDPLVGRFFSLKNKKILRNLSSDVVRKNFV